MSDDRDAGKFVYVARCPEFPADTCHAVIVDDPTLPKKFRKHVAEFMSENIRDGHVVERVALADFRKMHVESPDKTRVRLGMVVAAPTTPDLFA